MRRIFVSLLVLTALQSWAQGRITDRNSIGWLSYTGLFRFTGHWGLHTEYAWRRESFLEHWQQSLLRAGIDYRHSDKTTLRAGYAWAKTFAYGEIPLNGFGKSYNEHRIFEMAQVRATLLPFYMTQRFMLEQRWVGRYASADSETEDDHVYSNRFRYQLRFQLPLTSNSPDRAYLAAYDEIFMAFGPNVGQNVFDQNRFGILMGGTLTDWCRIEGGYLNQLIHFGRKIDGQDVYQKNNGFTLSGIFTFDCRKKPTESKP